MSDESRLSPVEREAVLKVLEPFVAYWLNGAVGIQMTKCFGAASELHARLSAEPAASQEAPTKVFCDYCDDCKGHDPKDNTRVRSGSPEAEAPEPRWSVESVTEALGEMATRKDAEIGRLEDRLSAANAKIERARTALQHIVWSGSATPHQDIARILKDLEG